MKIIFFGSDDFAHVHLNALIDSEHEVVACVTQPDRAKGRGMKVVSSPIKLCADQKQIDVLQPTNLKESSFMDALKAYQADLFVVIAYGRILPAEVLEIPKLYSINVHASLLPKYRGAAPINWAIINGDPITGISIIKMTPTLDAGDILVQKQINIDEKDSSATLRTKMVQVGPKVLLDTINAVAGDGADSFKPIVQDQKKVTFAPKLSKELGRIKWEQDAKEIYNLVRGLLPWPTAYTFYDEKVLKVLETEVVNQEGEAGEVLEVTEQGFVVACAQDALLIKKVHLESAKAMDASEFVRGHRLKAGFKFPSI